MTSTRQRALVIILIGLGVLIVGFFGLRTFRAFREFGGHRPPHRPFENRPAETNVELIRDWMTIGFISRSYRLPPKMLYDAINIPPNGNEHKSLKQLNDQYFPDKTDYVLTTVKATIKADLPPAPPATAIPPATQIPPTAP